MVAILSLVLVSFAAILAIPVALFFVEIIAALALPQWKVPLFSAGNARRTAVIVPAHNESVGIVSTLNNIKQQLHSRDRLLVVADNCTDQTAEVAKLVGADVIERKDPTKIGKGYALDWGVRHLSADPPDIVVIIDADCRLADMALDHLTTACATTGRPAQARYLMNAPNGPRIDYQVAAFAFRVKNWVRPLGLRALRLPCQLMGTGMAFPWEVIQSADLASGAAVEDLKLGLDLAEMGHLPLFCPLAAVSSEFPPSLKGAKTQRKRWEQGHLGVIARNVPRLACQALFHGKFDLLALTLDAAIPPVTLLGILASLMMLVSACGFLLGLSSWALIVSAASLFGYGVAILLCWLKYGLDVLPPRSILSVAPYVARKLPLYKQIFSRREKSEWVRTDRGESAKDVQEDPY